MVRTSKVFLTVVTAASLVLSMFALAIQALADTNNPAPLHVHYFTENVEYKAGVPGDSFQFVVQFTNGGQKSFVKGSAGNEARLGTGWTFGDTANPADNTADFTNGWSVNWLSSNRLTAQTEATVLPGTNATFTYTGKIPVGAPAGKKQIKAQPVVDGAAWLENYGYYQGFDVQATGAGAAPSVTTISTPNGTARVLVCFSKPMMKSDGFSIDDIDHFAIAGYTILASLVNADSTCTTLVVRGTTPATYAGIPKDSSFTVTVTDVADTAGNLVSPNPTSAPGTASDSVSPTVLSISQPGTYTIVVKFSESIDPNTATVGGFRWDSTNMFDGTSGTSVAAGGSGNVPAAVGTTGNRNFRISANNFEQVRLDFICPGTSGSSPACPVTNGLHSLDIKDIKDAAGNTLTPNPTSFSVTIIGTNDTVAPTVTATALQAADLFSPEAYSQYIQFDFSESMMTAGALGSNNFPNLASAAIDTAGNYLLQNPDGSNATTSCVAGVGTPISTLGGAGSSMSRSQTNRFELRRVRWRIAGGVMQTGCAYKIQLTGLRDEAGNLVNGINVNILTVTATQDTTAPTVIKATATSNKVLVVFSKAMLGSANATTVTNYTSTSSTLEAWLLPTTAPCNTPPGTTAAVNGNGDETTVIIQNLNVGCTLQPGTYPLTITGVTDPAGNVLTPNPTTLTITFNDTTAPTVTAAALGPGAGYTGPACTAANNQCFNVTFSKPMTAGAGGANSAGNTTNYSVNNQPYGSICGSGTPTITATSTSAFTVQCSGWGIWTTSASAPVTVGAQVVTIRNAADQFGNVISPNPSSRGF